MDRFYVGLGNRAVVRVSGEDRKNFLQGLITNDINKVNSQQAIYACILTPQGKFIFDLFIAEQGETFLLDVEKSTSEALVKKLTMYKLRSKVEITLEKEYEVWALLGKDALSGALGELKIHAHDGVGYIDPRDSEMGARTMVSSSNLFEGFKQEGYQEKPYQFYENLRIARGIPATGTELLGEISFPLQNNLEEFNAIDFDKGCYVGQEVTARSKHRGVIRKKLYKIEVTKGKVTPGEKANIAGKNIGEIKSVSENRALALLELEGAEPGTLINAGAAELKLV